MPVPASCAGIVIVNVLGVGTVSISNTFVVKLAFVKVVTPPPGKDTEVNLK
jgi:hypothetical protein